MTNTKQGFAAWHPKEGLMLGTVSILPQETTARLMRTGIAGLHGWEVVRVEVRILNDGQALPDGPKELDEKPYADDR